MRLVVDLNTERQSRKKIQIWAIIFRRKSLSGNWKTNIGQSILEEIPITDKHKMWIDAVTSIWSSLNLFSICLSLLMEDWNSV
jgi:hypothetical protein